MLQSIHPLLTRLERTLDVTESERSAIRRVGVQPAAVEADEVIVREGDRPSRCFLVAEGWAATSKLVGHGGRQILALHLAGDLPDLHSLHLTILDSDICAITNCQLAFMPHRDMHRLCHEHPRIADELWRITLVDASIYREWMVNVSQRQALSRLAHLFCELLVRSRMAGLAQDGSCPLPITQADVAEMTGLSLVHVNRTLQDLRAQNLISVGHGTLTVHDWDRLVELGDFRPDYLHLSPVHAA
ncbi:MAG TPA: Crp/Fnr family transcriptional regulator [Rubellimicrobium sp.]|nr:Crp/Fnr family transcriptional regulator [Rubellimicrobium sp.]